VKIVLIVLMLLIAAVITGAIVAGPKLRETLTDLTPEPRGTVVRTETAEIRQLVETVSAPGEIQPHTDVQIQAEVSAKIIELPFEEGDKVRRGEIVCRLDDKNVRASLLSATAMRDADKFRLRSDQARLGGLGSNLEFAQRELERQRKLFETGDISSRDLDEALERVRDLESSIEATKLSISVAESSLAAAEAEIERVEDALAKTVIESPIDGWVAQLNVEVGEVVTGSTTNPGTIMMTIADFSRMVLKSEVAESDVTSVEVGQRARIDINAYPGDEFSGTVRHIALQRSLSQNATPYFETEIEIDLRDRQIHLSGLEANVDIEIETHEGIVVPYQAIVNRDVESLPPEIRDNPLVDRLKRKAIVVYRVVDGRAVCTPVRGGASDLTHRVVLDGLDVGDVVITGPFKVLESIKHDELVSIEGEKDAETTEQTETDTDAETSAPSTDENGAIEPDDGQPTESPSESDASSDGDVETEDHEASEPEPVGGTNQP
jgi:HlyD family secretion protein